MTSTKVKFVPVSGEKKGCNAVDFAIAINAVKTAENGPQSIFLVSMDKHFSTIASLLQKEFKSCKIFHIATIWDGIIRNDKYITDLNMAKEFLNRRIGKEQGEPLFDKIVNLTIAAEQAKAKPQTRLSLIKQLLRIS